MMGDLKVKEAQALGRIFDLEATIKAMPENLGVDPFPLTHHFADGVYMREILIPKDSVLVGKMHRHQHFLIFLSGDATVVSSEGRKRVDEPQIFVSPVGAKRSFYAHADTRLVTVHVTQETDLDKIEEECIISNYEKIDIPGIEEAV